MARENLYKSDGMLPAGENWNAADGFSKLNILRLLVETNLCETIAQFGVQNIDDISTPEILTQKRIIAINRLIFILHQIMTNTRFAIKTHLDTDLMLLLKQRLDSVEEFIEGIKYETINSVTKEVNTMINEKHFKICLDILSSIKEELFGVLNRASLIFKSSEETDLDGLLNSLMLD